MNNAIWLEDREVQYMFPEPDAFFECLDVYDGTLPQSEWVAAAQKVANDQKLNIKFLDVKDLGNFDLIWLVEKS